MLYTWRLDIKRLNLCMRSRFRSLSRQMICSRRFSELLWVVSISRASSLIFFFLATSSTGIWKLCKPEEEAIVLNYNCAWWEETSQDLIWFSFVCFCCFSFLRGASSSLDCAPNIFLWSVAWERERSKTGGFLRWARYRSGACICGRYQSRADVYIASLLHDTWFVLHCNIWMRWVVVLDGCFLPVLQIKQTCDINCTHLFCLYKSSVNL